MFLNEKYKNNILNFTKFIKKNILIILIVTLSCLSFSIFYIIKNNSYSSKIELLVNLDVFNEIKFPIIYAFESKEFNDYLDEKIKKDFINSTLSKNKPGKKSEIKDSIKYFPSIRTGDPYVSVVYSNKSEDLTEKFSEEFVKVSNEFFTNKKNSILDDQISKLQNEYNNLKKENISLESSSDPQLISLISKLTYWKTLRTQNIPMISLINSDVYPTLNKKLILVFAFIVGGLLGIFIALIKETIKELNEK